MSADAQNHRFVVFYHPISHDTIDIFAGTSETLCFIIGSMLAGFLMKKFKIDCLGLSFSSLWAQSFSVMCPALQWPSTLTFPFQVQFEFLLQLSHSWLWRWGCCSFGAVHKVNSTQCESLDDMYPRTLTHHFSFPKDFLAHTNLTTNVPSLAPPRDWLQKLHTQAFSYLIFCQFLWHVLLFPGDDAAGLHRRQRFVPDAVSRRMQRRPCQQGWNVAISIVFLPWPSCLWSMFQWSDFVSNLENPPPTQSALIALCPFVCKSRFCSS